jgi:superoxide dismutase, Cu-Zn family
MLFIIKYYLAENLRINKNKNNPMAHKMKKKISVIALILLSVFFIPFYSCKKKDEVTSSDNKPPVAKAGVDKSITFPTDSVVLDGSGSSDPDGSISYLWTKINGGICTLDGTGASKLTVKGLMTGKYTFKLTTSDVFGASSSDDVIVDVLDLNKTATSVIDKVYMDTTISGTATFKQKNNENVILTLDVTCPYKANKSVAVHMHMMPDCGGMAANAKGHWNPTNASHGKWGGAAGTFHIGDIGNINLDGTGHATYTVSTNLWNINGADTSRNVIHRSIMIHSGVDNYTTQPTGASGTKIGCGAIK